MAVGLNFPDAFPHDKVRVIDQTTYVESTTSTITDPRAFMPFVSPKGVGYDDQLVDLSSRSDLTKYGKPNLKKYGLSFYLPYKYIAGGGSVLGMRVMPNDATHANVIIVAKYKVETGVTLTNDDGDTLYTTPGGEVTTDAGSGANTEIQRDILTVKLLAQNASTTDANDVESLTTYMNGLASTTPDADSFLTAPLFAIHMLPKGVFGNSMKTTLSLDTSTDIDLPTIRPYKAELTEGGDEIITPMSFCLDEEFLYNTLSYFGDDVFQANNNMIGMVTSNHLETFLAAVEANALTTTSNRAATSIETEDSWRNIDIFSNQTPNGNKHFKYVLDDASVDLSAGISLAGGSDGKFAQTETAKITNMENELITAYNGTKTDKILDEVMYPFMHVIDCGDSVDLKTAIHKLATDRYSTFAILNTVPVKSYTEATAIRSSTMNTGTFNSFKSTLYVESAMAYDEFTGKNQRFPASYFNAMAYAQHCVNTGYPVPFAGKYFQWTGFLPGTLQPQSSSKDVSISLHRNRMNQMVEKLNGTAQPVQQLTTQTLGSKLLEINNVHMLLYMTRLALELSDSERWAFNTDTYIDQYRTKVIDKIDRELNGYYDSLTVSTQREAANGPGANRIRCSITVDFSDILKGVSYDFYVV